MRLKDTLLHGLCKEWQSSNFLNPPNWAGWVAELDPLFSEMLKKELLLHFLWCWLYLSIFSFYPFPLSTPHLTPSFSLFTPLFSVRKLLTALGGTPPRLQLSTFRCEIEPIEGLGWTLVSVSRVCCRVPIFTLQPCMLLWLQLTYIGFCLCTLLDYTFGVVCMFSPYWYPDVTFFLRCNHLILSPIVWCLTLITIHCAILFIY